MGEPLISIVIPVYKPDAFFLETLQSIQQQTLQDFEVVVSDDSPEHADTKKYIGQFSQLDIKYIQSNQEKGIFHNLNNAIRHSSGRYIQIFCQDDVMLPGLLESQVELFKQYPSIGMGFSNYVGIDEQSQPFPQHKHIVEAINSWEEFIPSPKAKNYFFAFGCIPGSLSTVMLKREVFEKIGYFNTALPFAGDFDYWIRVSDSFDVGLSKIISVQVRIHQQQATQSLGLNTLMPDMIAIYKRIYNNNTVRVSKLRKSAQVNNLVAGYFKAAVKGVLQGRFQNFRAFKYFQRFPFRIPMIMLVILHRSIKGKVSWFIKESAC